MGKKTIIPFGPQHPVLPEPVHLDLVLEDEKVVDVIPSIGYIHRGLEKLVDRKEFTEMVYIIERVCGICSFGHGWGASAAIEGTLDLEIPERANYLRTIWHELSRIHSHLLWLGLLADAFGFESLFMHSWRIRETVLDIFEKTTGGRVIFSVCKVGGVRRDIDAETLSEISEVLEGVRKELKPLTEVFLTDASVANRTRGVGILTTENAKLLGAVGPVARGSGLALDMRLTGLGAYGELGFEPIVREEGDCYARMAVRIAEIDQSIDLIQRAAANMPEGPIEVPVKGNPMKDFIVRIEQPRGEAFYFAKGNGTKKLSRMRVRTPTNQNIPPLIHMMKGAELADVPILVLTIDPCISCTER